MVTDGVFRAGTVVTVVLTGAVVVLASTVVVDVGTVVDVVDVGAVFAPAVRRWACGGGGGGRGYP